jgi:hypothetical protein
MEGQLNKVADGTARGVGLWFTLSHVAYCPQCRRFLESLKAMIGKLHKARDTEPSEESIRRILASYKAQATSAPRD